MWLHKQNITGTNYETHDAESGDMPRAAVCTEGGDHDRCNQIHYSE